MDNPRLFLWIGFALLVVDEHHPVGSRLRQRIGVPRPRRRQPSARPRRRHPRRHAAVEPAVAAGGSAAPPPARPPQRPRAAAGAAAAAANAPTMRVVTDVLDLDISLQGGDLLRADLLKYPLDKKPGSPPVRLLTTDDSHVQRRAQRPARGRRPCRTEPPRARTPPLPPNSACAGRAGTARAADLDGRAGRHRDEDLRLPPGQYAIDVAVRRAERVRRRLEGGFVRAVRAPRVPAEALDVRRRELRLPRPGRVRRQEVPEARRRRRRRRQVPPGRSPAAGWPRCSTTSSSAAVPPRASPTNSRCSAKATIRWSATAAR